MSARNPMVKCHARNRAGDTCGHWAMHGQSVCYLHGGKSPQALASAQERFKAHVMPAISALGRLIEQDDLGAVKYVLDYVGFKAVDKVQSDSDVTIVVRRVDQPILDAPYADAHD
jgi:hypothetical protein